MPQPFPAVCGVSDMGDSLRVQLRNMPANGWQWHGLVSAVDLQDAARGMVDALPAGGSDLDWTASLARRGDGWHLAGEWRVTVRVTCSRCNAPVDAALGGRFMRHYRMGDAAPDAAGQDDEWLPFPGCIDLVDVLREEIWLAWPQRVTCRPGCRGLCPHCGVNLNQASCACADQRDDHPFAALKKLMD